MSLVIVTYFAIFLYSAAFGSITNPPVDTEAIANQTVIFSCIVDSNSNKIEWHHTPVGFTTAKTVYLQGTVYNSYQKRVNVTCSVPERKCDLTIGRVSAVDAGRYICVEGISSAAAELIVFDLVPSRESCHVRPTSSDLIIGKNDCGLKQDIVIISCSYKYFGNKSPSMVWTDEKQTIISPEAPVIKDNVTTSSVRLTASVNEIITCTIQYSGSYPSSRFKWPTTIQVETFLNTSTVQHTSCSSPAITCRHQYQHHQCEIRWKRENGSAVSDEILKLPSGTYLCVADCIVRYKPCVVQQLKVYHECALDWSTVDARTSSNGDSTVVIAAATAVGVLITSIVVGVILGYVFCRKSLEAIFCCCKTTNETRNTELEVTTLTKGNEKASRSSMNEGKQDKAEPQISPHTTNEGKQDKAEPQISPHTTNNGEETEPFLHPPDCTAPDK